MAWISFGNVEGRLAQIMADGNWEPSKLDKEIVNGAIGFAKSEIVRILRTRGYTLAQIDTWDQQSYYHTEISLYFSLFRRAYKKDDEQDWIDDFDLRSDLEEIELFTAEPNSTLIDPAETSEGIFEIIDLEAANEALDQEP